MSDKNFKVKNGIDANGTITVSTGQAPGVGLILRGYGSQTADLQQWQYSDGNTYARISPYGQLAIGDVNPSIYSNARISLNTVATSAVGLVIRGVSSQTANLQEWQDSTGASRTVIQASGSFFSNHSATLTNAGAGGGNAIFTRTLYASAVPVVVRGAASQTANLQEWQDSAGTVLASISSTGKLTSAADALINGITLGWGGGQSYQNLAFGYNALSNTTTGVLNMAMGYRALQANTTGWNNMALGADALVANTTGQNNTAIGAQSLYGNTNGGENVAIGNWALLGGNGAYNTAVGASSMNLNSSSQFNTAVGRLSLYSISYGSHNTAIGQQAGGSLTSGASNAILGSEALLLATTGSNNIAVGRDAGHSVVTGSANVFLGYQAGYSETGSNKLYISNSNTATPLIGGDFSASTLTLSANTTILSKTASTVGLIVKAISDQSTDIQQWKRSDDYLLASINQYGSFYTAGNLRVSVFAAFGSSTRGTEKVFILNDSAANAGLIVKGAASQTANLQEWQNSSGTALSKIDKDGNIIANYETSSILGGGGRAVIDPYGAIYTVDTLTVGSTSDRFATGAATIIHRSGNATDLTLGIRAMASQTGDLTQWRNSANTVLAKVDSIGNATFNTVYVGLGGGSIASNIALGGSALSSNTTGYVNTAIGLGALQSNTTGWGNTGIGTYALQYYSGNVNTGIGYSALRYATQEGLVAIGFGALASNTSGGSNTAVGYAALNANIIGGANTAFGSQSSRLSTGDRNTSVGFYSAYNLTTGTDNTFLGSQTGQSFTTGSSNIAIGSFNSWYGTSTGSGNTFVGTDGGGTVTGSNNTTLGYQATISSSSVSNEITLGNSSVTKFRIPGTGFISDTSKTYSAKELDLRDVSTQFTNTGSGSIGQKINLWGGVYGIGVENGTLVNYIPSTNSFAIKNSYGGASLFSIDGTAATFSSNLTVSGNLTVNGTTTNLNSTNLVIEDKNIIIADVATPTDTTADGAGITIKGATDKTLTWVNSTKSFTTSDPLIIDGTNSTTVPLLVKVPTAQTTNSFEVQDSRGYSMFKVIAPAGGTAYNNGAIWIRPWGTGNVAAMGTDSYQGFYFVSPAASTINFGTGGGGKAFEIVVNDTFNRYKVEGKGTGVAPIFTTNGNDTDVNMHIYPKGAGKIGINTTTPTGYVHAVSSSSSTVGLIVEGASGQTSTNIFEVQRAGGSDPSFTVSHNYIDLNRNTTAAASMTVYGSNAGQVPLYVKGRASQSVNLQEWQNSTGQIRASIGSNGNLSLNYATGIRLYNTANTDYASLWMDNGSAGTNLYVKTNYPVLMGDVGVDTGASLTVATQSVSQIGQVIRGISSQTADLQQWQRSNGNPDLKVTNFGTLISGGGTTIASNPTINAYGAAMVISSGVNTYPMLILKAAASQSANIQEWQNSAGTAVAAIGPNGTVYMGSTNGANIANFYNGTNGYGAGAITSGGTFNINGANMGFPYTASGATLSVNAQSANQIGMTVRGYASQSFNLQEWQDSSGSAISWISSYGGARLYDLGIKGSPAGISWAYFGNDNTSTKNVVVRGFASQTASLQEWQDSGGSILSRVSSAGSIFVSSSGTRLSGVGGDLVAIATSATVVPITSRGFASQTADLQQWLNSAGTVLSNVASNGRINAIQFGNVTGGNAVITTAADTGSIRVNTNGAANKGLVVQGSASQTGNLQEWQDSAGTTLALVDAYGRLGINATSLANSTGGYSMVSIYNNNTVNTNLVIKSYPSQTATLTEWQNSSGTTLAKIDVLGNFTATSKSFDIEHPTKENMRLRYGSLEGPENGVYIRGTVESNIIELPDYWTGLVHEDSITVSLTPVGSAQNIYVEKIENNKIYIGGNLEKAFFTVYGERKDIDKLTVEY
jgi:hypothetical protein